MSSKSTEPAWKSKNLKRLHEFQWSTAQLSDLVQSWQMIHSDWPFAFEGGAYRRLNCDMKFSNSSQSSGDLIQHQHKATNTFPLWTMRRYKQEWSVVVGVNRCEVTLNPPASVRLTWTPWICCTGRSGSVLLSLSWMAAASQSWRGDKTENSESVLAQRSRSSRHGAHCAPVPQQQQSQTCCCCLCLFNEDGCQMIDGQIEG